MKKNPVVHFEMPYVDRERLAKFYEGVFGWKMNPLGEEMGHYVVAHTTETDDGQMVKTPGNINGGFYPQKSAPEATCPSVVIAVENIMEAIEKVKEAGGQILGEPMDIPGVGKYVSFRDTENNRVSVLESLKR